MHEVTWASFCHGFDLSLFYVVCQLEPMFRDRGVCPHRLSRLKRRARAVFWKAPFRWNLCLFTAVWYLSTVWLLVTHLLCMWTT